MTDNTDNGASTETSRLDADSRFRFIEKLSFFPEKVERVLAADPVGALSVVYLDLNTDVCNHTCHFCDGFYRSLAADALTRDRLMQLADEFDDVGVKAVVIAGDRGEPLMHPGAADVITRLARSDIAVGIYTNGTVISNALRKALRGVSWLRLSADAGSAQTHRLMHGYPASRNDFTRMLKNLRALSPDIPDIGCSFILDPLNVHEIELAADVLLDAGAMFVEYKPKYLPNYEVDTAWLLDRREAIGEALAAARRRWAGKVIVNAQIEALLSRQSLPKLTVPPRQCRTSLLRMVISTHGCYPCTPYRGVADHGFGDIRTQPLREILNSARRRQLMQLPCTLKCAYDSQNEFLLSIDTTNDLAAPPERAARSQDSFI
jgi:MoaA/NifB/PqqE/SkfB family radical SAM enzyme